MTIKCIGRITRDIVQADRGAVFVFGNNTNAKGVGGQAKAMRGEPNSISIATKQKRKLTVEALFADNEAASQTTMRRTGARNTNLAAFKSVLAGKTAYVPRDGPGAGLFELPRRARKLSATLPGF